MRRAELAALDQDHFAEVARDCPVGYVVLSRPDGPPRAVALDFVAIGETVYFHGAVEGEKAGLIGAGAPCGFTMVKEYSFIPSHFTAPDFACPATHFFKSVEIAGRCEPVADPAEKARALQALMQKYQPEGGFAPLTADQPAYARALARVGVFRITPDRWTGKRKFGQNEPAAVRAKIAAALRDRGRPVDLATAAEIEAAGPAR